jgi:hypothetical protein
MHGYQTMRAAVAVGWIILPELRPDLLRISHSSYFTFFKSIYCLATKSPAGTASEQSNEMKQTQLSPITLRTKICYNFCIVSVSSKSAQFCAVMHAVTLCRVPARKPLP